MRIKNIEIDNFKGIENKKIVFNQSFTVLIGENGAGKTSILDAVSIAMGTMLMKTGAKFGLSGARNRPLFKDEIRKIMISPNNEELTAVRISGEFVYGGNTIEFCRDQSVNSSSLNYRYASELANIGLSIIGKLNKDESLPLLVYHSTGRLWGEIYSKKGDYEKVSSRLDGYYACLDSRSITQKFISWFKTYEDEILKFGADKSLYIAFTSAITSIVPQWSKIHYSWKQGGIMGLTNEKQLLEEKTSIEKWLPLRNLSDGYKGIVSLVADIAYRAIKLNPHLGERAILETEGIVLIDEIDMHLHPKWQRHIVEDLKKTFPNIQFIVTTHSPFIVQSLKADEVINLDENQLSDDPDTLSIEENALFMGVSDDNSDKFERKEKLATEYLNLISDNKPSKEALERLEALLIEFSDDPAFVAKLKLERLIKLGS